MSGIRYIWKHAFDFYYKWTPTASLGLPEKWPHNDQNAAYNNGPQTLQGGFYNFNHNENQPSILTRDIARLSSSAGALPLGSSAADYLWNCLVPTQSVYDSSSYFSISKGWQTFATYSFIYSSASLFHTIGFLGLTPI